MWVQTESFQWSQANAAVSKKVTSLSHTERERERERELPLSLYKKDSHIQNQCSVGSPTLSPYERDSLSHTERKSAFNSETLVHTQREREREINW